MNKYLFNDNCELIQDSSALGVTDYTYDLITGKLVSRHLQNIEEEEYKYINDTLTISTIYALDIKKRYVTRYIKSKSGRTRIIVKSDASDPLYFDSSIYNYGKNGLLVEKKVITPRLYLVSKYIYDSSNRLIRINERTNHSNTYFDYLYSYTDSSSSVIERYFNFDGKLIEVSSEKVFDQEKRLIEYKTKDVRYIYTYNSLNKLLVSEMINLISHTKTIKKYTYNVDGTINTIEMIFPNRKVSMLKFTYYK
ncbi:hypothetical protein [Sporocytophaga myxococcoides]|uniref:hypothetical protein n=1 Tax=Sporocytophaga myxococcoides TaxID=153721 RepID=UPI0012DD1B0F|nr:hypothetical protein [Sporocytophaga myxococcoides]